MRLSREQVRGPVLAVALLLVPVGLLLKLVVVPAWQAYGDNRAEIIQLREQLAGFRRAAADLETLEGRLRTLRERHAASRYTLSQGSETLAAAALQERVKKLVGRHGGDLVSTRVLPVEPQQEFTRVGVNVQMRASIDVLRNVLYELESGEPMLIVNDLLIQSSSGGMGQRRRPGDAGHAGVLNLRFDLAGFIRREAAS